jgi:hypothetical protein
VYRLERRKHREDTRMSEVLLRLRGLTLRRDDGTGSAILNVRSP